MKSTGKAQTPIDRPPPKDDRTPEREHPTGRVDHRREEREKERDKRQERLKREWKALRQDRGRTFTPWLLIRSMPWDYGLRPLPAGTAFWLSPDIWVESSDSFGRAVAGEPNFLHARVYNLGKTVAIPTRVDFYWADPSVGLGAEHMNLVGTEWVEVPAHAGVDVRCNTPWVPAFLNGGHECLKVNCNNALLDPIHFPFEPWRDRHAGQRNITVLEGQPGGITTLELNVNNVFRRAVRMELHLQIDHLQVDRSAGGQLKPRELIERVLAFGQPPRPTAKALLAGSSGGDNDIRQARAAARLTGEAEWAERQVVKRIREGERSAPSVRHHWVGESRRIVPAAAALEIGKRKQAGMGEGGVKARPAAGVVLNTTEFEGFEQRRLKLEIGVPVNAVPGEFLVAHVDQRVGTAVVGGYTLVIAVGG